MHPLLLNVIMRYPPLCLLPSSTIPSSTWTIPSSSLIHLVTFVSILSLYIPRYFIAAHWFSSLQSPSSFQHLPGLVLTAFSNPEPRARRAHRAYESPQYRRHVLIPLLKNARTDIMAISGARIEGLPPTSHSGPGYVPGAGGSPLPPAAPSFAAFAPDGAGAGFPGVGPWAALDPARAAAASSSSSTAAYSTSFSPLQDPRERAREDALAATCGAAAHADAERTERESAPYPRLRTVVLPQATLPQFLVIASVNNSARNSETSGLLLSWEVMRAFHPHPDVPIYTDADRGHVQMRDVGLEIVDLW
ncbi:hypothetical protein DFH09DRAFT_1371323 [Mycena vulgaris]|nr:hypothetical protein DFH09DRAFT_1371323 [Mycena vulgaris]